MAPAMPFNTLLPYVCSVPGMLSMEGSRDVKFSGSLGSRVHNKKAGRNTLTGDKAGVLTDAIQTSTRQHTGQHLLPPAARSAAAAASCCSSSMPAAAVGSGAALSCGSSHCSRFLPV